MGMITQWRMFNYKGGITWENVFVTACPTRVILLLEVGIGGNILLMEFTSMTMMEIRCIIMIIPLCGISKNEYDKRAYNMDDKCKGCIRLDSKMKYKINTCPKCNEETYESYLEGRSYIRKCKHCGHGSLSFSYFGNCEGKRHMCEYVLDFSNVSKEGIVEFGGRYNIRVVTLLKLIRMNKVARLRCDISEVLDEEKFFDSIELGYVMDPPMQYSNFYTCKDSIRAQWLDSTVEVFFG